MDELLRWAAAMGVSDAPLDSPSAVPSSCLGRTLTVAQFPDAGGRGLAAARDIRRGELVLRVPREALLTSDSVAANDPAIAAAVKQHPQLSPAQILSVCLLAEMGKGSNSIWSSYLKQLPRYYTTLQCFKDVEINSLQVDDAIWVAQKAVEKTELDWQGAKTLMKELSFKPQFLTFQSWLWASSTVSSRTLHIPWDAAGCLCPVGDLFNYAAPEEESASSQDEVETNVTDFSNSYERIAEQRLTDGGFDETYASYCFYARESYRKGEQVLLCYGTYTNLELLEHYGFILPENPNGKAFIPLHADIYSAGRCSTELLFIKSDGSPSYALQCALRLWATPVNQRKSVGHAVYSGSVLGAENELTILNWLGRTCEDILQGLPTSCDGDSSLLCFLDEFLDTASGRGSMHQSSSKELAVFAEACGLRLEDVTREELGINVLRSLERWRLVIQWRYYYKRTLSRCIAYCQDRISNLST